MLQEASIYRGADFWLSFLPLWGPKSTIQSQAPLNVKQRCQTSFFCFTSSRLTLNVWFYCSCRENKRKQHLFSVMLLLTLQPTDLLLNTWFFSPSTSDLTIKTKRVLMRLHSSAAVLNFCVNVDVLWTFLLISEGVNLPTCFCGSWRWITTAVVRCS